MEAKKGNFDVRVAKGEGICFNQEELRSFETDRDTKKVTGGYQTNELFQAYLVGVKDDEINRSLYKYTKSVRGNDIVINDTLARREDKGRRYLRGIRNRLPYCRGHQNDTEV